MKRQVSPAFTTPAFNTLAWLCIVAMLGGVTLGCKARGPIPDQGGHGGDNPPVNNTGKTDPDPKLLQQIDELKAENQKLEGELESLQAASDTMLADLQKLQSGTGEKDQQISTLQTALEQANAKIADLNQRITVQVQTIFDLQTQIEDLKRGQEITGGTVLPPPASISERPDIADGFERFSTEGGVLSFDYPTGWSVKQDFGGDWDSLSYLVVSPDGNTTMKITLWNYLRGAPHNLATQAFNADMSTLANPTVIAEVQNDGSPAQIIAAQDTYSAQVGFEQDGQPRVHRFGVANLRSGTDAYWTAMAEVTYTPDNADAANAAFETMAKSIFIAGN